MASGSRARGHGSAVVAGADALDTLINPDLAHLPAVDLVAHLRRNSRSWSVIADVALVVAVRERTLAATEARVRAAEAETRTRADTIRALELRIANAEALVRDRTVAVGEDESQAGDHLTAVSDIVGAAELTGGEIRARDLEIVVSELGAAGEITPGVGFDFEAGAEVGDDEDDIPCPIPLMRIDASPVPFPVTAAPALPDELIEERAVEEVVMNVAVPRSHNEVADFHREKASEAIARKRKKPASDLSSQLDDLRVTSHKVSDEEAHGEDVIASPHRRSQAEQPAKATKKARRQKEMTSFYIMVFKALKEKENLLKKKEEEALAKKAAAAASKPVHCKCYWS